MPLMFQFSSYIHYLTISAGNAPCHQNVCIQVYVNLHTLFWVHAQGLYARS